MFTDKTSPVQVEPSSCIIVRFYRSNLLQIPFLLQLNEQKVAQAFFVNYYYTFPTRKTLKTSSLPAYAMTSGSSSEKLRGTS